MIFTYFFTNYVGNNLIIIKKKLCEGNCGIKNHHITQLTSKQRDFVLTFNLIKLIVHLSKNFTVFSDANWCFCYAYYQWNTKTHGQS